jgi:hypothetical protein
MPWVGFEPTTPVFEREKTVHALDHVATVIGILSQYWVGISYSWAYPFTGAYKCNLYFWRQSIHIWGIRDSTVDLATGYGLDDRGIGFRVAVESRIFSCRPDRLCGPPSLIFNGYRGLFPREVRRQRREADHSPPSSAKIKKMKIYTSTPPYI